MSCTKVFHSSFGSSTTLNSTGRCLFMSNINSNNNNEQHPPQILSLGNSVQTIESSPQDCFELVGQFWLPTDDNLPPPSLPSTINPSQNSPTRWVSQLLRPSWVPPVSQLQMQTTTQYSSANLQDDQLTQLVLASEIPPPSSPSKELTTKSRNDMDNHPSLKERNWVLESLHGLHLIVGCQQQQQSSSAALSLSARTLLGILTTTNPCRWTKRVNCSRVSKDYKQELVTWNNILIIKIIPNNNKKP
jgi:hypothetical protein